VVSIPRGFQPIAPRSFDLPRRQPLQAPLPTPYRPQARGSPTGGHVPASPQPPADPGLPADVALILRAGARYRSLIHKCALACWSVPAYPDRWYAWARLRLWPRARSFFRAWAGRRVPPSELEARMASCSSCRSRRLVHARDYCTARSCGCPQAWWWPWATLSKMARLRAVRCPRQLWPHG